MIHLVCASVIVGMSSHQSRELISVRDGVESVGVQVDQVDLVTGYGQATLSSSSQSVGEGACIGVVNNE